MRQAEAVSEAVAEACQHQQESAERQMSTLRHETDELRMAVDNVTAVSESTAAAAAAAVISIICLYCFKVML